MISWKTNLLFLYFIFIILLPGYSQDGEPELALLERGPVFTEGIPFLAPNVLEAYMGRYRIGEASVIVYFSREPVITPGNWEPFRCGTRDYLTFLYKEGKGYFLESPKGWVVFIYFEIIDENHCRFTESFFNRLNYFLSISDTFSLPAVFELK